MSFDPWDTIRNDAFKLAADLIMVRAERKQSVRLFADLHGVDPSVISRIENGRAIPTPPLAARLRETVLQHSETFRTELSGGWDCTPLPVPSRATRAGDPDTSHQAARTVNLDQRPLYRWWLHHLNAHAGLADYWATMEGALADYNNDHTMPWVSPSGFRSRAAELRAAGLIEDSGRRAELNSGRMGMVLQITPEGRQAINQTKETPT